MNTNDDSLLLSLLQYHTRIVDQQFVDDIINSIKTKNKFRLKVMTVAMLLACSLAIPLIGGITEELVFFNDFAALSPYIITVFSLLVLGFFAWLSNDSF
ncbi:MULTISPECIES: hypothetical protein [unclassified Pseudoalteromonas]|jgi:hypothetical protein|uniref:hypothetical protein n=1 Tax=unclassified Pseudoalteromonas TaxID=194690 RepID=UPI000731FD5C|nr:hypothetical protein [Pseudoalteromonas sp. 10-33]KTF10176.1 hypothetical protein ATS76_09360 [Pseudoalteromonas sp. 10-33]MDC2855750.1 hypothetical protein [Ningiella sp. W23]